jgi:hypothetical protein
VGENKRDGGRCQLVGCRVSKGIRHIQLVVLGENVWRLALFEYWFWVGSEACRCKSFAWWCVERDLRAVMWVEMHFLSRIRISREMREY